MAFIQLGLLIVMHIILSIIEFHSNVHKKLHNLLSSSVTLLYSPLAAVTWCWVVIELVWLHKSIYYYCMIYKGTHDLHRLPMLLPIYSARQCLIEFELVAMLLIARVGNNVTR